MGTALSFHTGRVVWWSFTFEKMEAMSKTITRKRTYSVTNIDITHTPNVISDQFIINYSSGDLSKKSEEASPTISVISEKTLGYFSKGLKE